jgi:hypothetical protein
MIQTRRLARAYLSTVPIRANWRRARALSGAGNHRQARDRAGGRAG